MLTALSFMAEPSGSSQVEEIARTFGVDWPHLVAQTISFGIVCALLYWLAYRPILQMLEARRQQIATGLAHAEQLKAELAKTEAQRKEVLAEAGRQSKQLFEEARAAAAAVQAEETRKAIASAEQIIVRANESAAAERTRMVADARREVARLVLQTTAAVTGKILTAEDQRRLAEETARQLPS